MGHPVLHTWVLVVGDLNFNKTIVVEFLSQVPQSIGFYVKWNTYYTTIISTTIWRIITKNPRI